MVVHDNYICESRTPVGWCAQTIRNGLHVKSVGLVERGGGGGGAFRAACTGAIGVGNERASVYNSSSDDEGDEERGESIGELKGFAFWRVGERWNSYRGRTPPGQSVTRLVHKTKLGQREH